MIYKTSGLFRKIAPMRLNAADKYHDLKRAMTTAMPAKSCRPERRSHTMSRKRRSDQYRER
jgi:hypothetical protein